MLSLINSGRGVARGVNFFVHANGQGTDNYVFDGFLAAGEGVTVVTPIELPSPPGVLVADLPDLAAMVVYRDGRGFVHYRTHTGVEYVPRTRIRRRRRFGGHCAPTSTASKGGWRPLSARRARRQV